MQNDGEAGQAAGDLFQNVESELGLGAGLELVCAVAGADGDSQRIAAGALNKFLNVLGTGVGGIFSRDIDLVFYAGKGAQLGLDHNAVVMGIFNNLTGQRDVFLKGFGGCVYHYGGETAVDAALAGLEAVTVVKVQSDGQAGLNHSGLNQLDQIGVVGISAGALGHLKNKRCVQIFRSFSDALHDLHIVHVECADGVSAVIGFLKHFFCCYQRHNQFNSLTIFCKFGYLAYLQICIYIISSICCIIKKHIQEKKQIFLNNYYGGKKRDE